MKASGLYKILFVQLLTLSVWAQNNGLIQDTIAGVCVDCVQKQGDEMKGLLPAQGNFKPYYTTAYHTLLADEVTNGVNILVNAGGVGPKITPADFCKASLEGAIKVHKLNGQNEYYTFRKSSVSCSKSSAAMCRQHRRRKLGCAIFVKTKAPLGSNGRPLEPFRTVAITRRSPFKIGQKIMIKEAVGAQITLPGGQKLTHDGIFSVGDTGSFSPDKIDVYIGETKATFPKLPAFINGKVHIALVPSK